jgi:hypothetical protein
MMLVWHVQRLCQISQHRVSKTASSLGLLLFLTMIVQCGPLIGLAIPVILNLLNEGYYFGGFLKLWEQGMSSIYWV